MLHFYNYLCHIKIEVFRGAYSLLEKQLLEVPYTCLSLPFRAPERLPDTWKPELLE